LEPLCPSKISQTILFSKPILLAGGRIAKIWAESQFSPDFRHINPSATRCYPAGKPKDPRPAPFDNGAIEQKPRQHEHTTSDVGSRLIGKKLGVEREMVAGYLPLYALPLIFPYVIGDCENRAAHSHNRHHELSLGFGGVGTVFRYGDSIKAVWVGNGGFEGWGVIGAWSDGYFEARR
jgi:hypothetical protein